MSDIRVTRQLGVLASLPLVFVAVLIALSVIHAMLGLALGLGALLLILDVLTGASPQRHSTAHDS